MESGKGEKEVGLHPTRKEERGGWSKVEGQRSCS
jgi:hypothetical protein